jgi:hypothetical protein
MEQYIKKPINITAAQWDGDLDNLFAISNKMGFKVGMDLVYNQPFIDSLQGRMIVYPGDYIIKEPNGNCYTCKADIFEEEYVRVYTYSDIKEEEGEEKPLTFGEKLVGLTFNPSGDKNVQRAKELCAELADLIYNDYDAKDEVSDFYDYLYEHTVGEILNAQMNVVKLLTFKY